MHLALDSHGLPLRIAVAGCTVVDCTQALSPVAGLKARGFTADNGHALPSYGRAPMSASRRRGMREKWRSKVQRGTSRTRAAAPIQRSCRGMGEPCRLR